MTLLADVVRTSTQVAGTSSRLAKTRLIADCLRRLDADEVAIALPYLSGELRQGKLTLGYATLQGALGAPAAAPALTLHDVDSAFESLKSAKGKGSAAQRASLLGSLFSRASAAEQDFLVRLIVGELRQGALEGLTIEAPRGKATLRKEDHQLACDFMVGETVFEKEYPFAVTGKSEVFPADKVLYSIAEWKKAQEGNK